MKSLTPALIAALVLLAVGLALGWLLFRGDPDLAGRLQDQRTHIEALHDSMAAVDSVAYAAGVEAGKKDAAARESVDTVRVAVTRWRERVDTLTVPQIIAAGDSLAAACERAADDCEAALDARDRQITALGASVAARDTTIVRIEEYRSELADRLKRSERWSWLRTVRDVAIGAAGAYAVCSLADC